MRLAHTVQSISRKPLTEIDFVVSKMQNFRLAPCHVSTSPPLFKHPLSVSLAATKVKRT